MAGPPQPDPQPGPPPADSAGTPADIPIRLPEPSGTGETVHVSRPAVSGVPMPTERRSKSPSSSPFAKPPGLSGAGVEKPRRSDLPAGTKLGEYTVTGVLGRGGMGVVYEAERSGHSGPVALKLLPEDLSDDPEAVARFVREGKAAARVDHGNVVRVLDVGQADGAPYLVMELVVGGTAQEHLDTRGAMEWPEATRVIADACRGLAAAHAAGIVHRDIKPSNIIRSLSGAVKVADFGLCKGSENTHTSLTPTGIVVGTPRFMSPEQCQARPTDARSDIYSLGAAYFALLTGKAPYGRHSTTPQIMYAHCYEPVPDPREPDGPAGSSSESSPDPAGSAAPAAPPGPPVPERIVRIVQRSMAKKPEDRFQSAVEMLAALEGALSGAPESKCSGRPPRGAVPLPRGTGVRLIAAAIVALGAAVAVRVMLDKPGAGSGGPGAASDAKPAKPGAPDSAVSRSPLDELRREDIPAYELQAAGEGGPAKAQDGLVAVRGDSRLRHWSSVRCTAVSPDGTRAATGGDDRAIRIWDMATGRTVGVLRGHEGAVNSLAFDPAGRRLISCSDDKTVRIWDAAAGTVVHVMPGHEKPVLAVAVSPDGAVIASGSEDQTIKLWDAATGIERRTIRGSDSAVTSVAFGDGGKRLAASTYGGAVRIIDAAAGTELRSYALKLGAVFAVTFDAAGRRLAAGCGGGEIRIWDKAGDQEVRTMGGHTGPISALSFGPDGRLASSGTDLTVRIWNTSDGSEIRSLPAHALRSTAVAFAPDGKRMVSAGQDGAVVIWDPDATDERKAAVLRPAPGATHAVVSRDGRRIAVGLNSGGFRVDSPGDLGNSRIRAEDVWITSLSFSPEADQLAVGSADKTVRIWDTAAGTVMRQLTPHIGAVMTLSYSPDGKRLAAGTYDGELKLWEPATGTELRMRHDHAGWVTGLAYSGDGRLLATGGIDGTVRLWDPIALDLRRTITAHDGWVTSVAASPDGKLIASGGRDNLVRVWDGASGAEVATFRGHSENVNSVLFSPDGRAVISAGSDGTVRIWNIEKVSQTRIWAIAPAGSEVWRAAYTPDGRHILTVNGNGTIYIIRIAPER